MPLAVVAAKCVSIKWQVKRGRSFHRRPVVVQGVEVSGTLITVTPASGEL